MAAKEQDAWTDGCIADDAAAAQAAAGPEAGSDRALKAAAGVAAAAALAACGGGGGSGGGSADETPFVPVVDFSTAGYGSLAPASDAEAARFL